MLFDTSFSLSCALLGGVLLLIGCSDEAGLGVTEGRYRLHVEGSLTDTLTGPAVYRRHPNGHLGLELGTPDGPGVSIDLKPLPRSPARPADGGRSALQLHPGRYDVLAGELLEGPRTDSLTGLTAFLSVADAQFVATHGRLTVTDVAKGTVEGMFNFEMEERGANPSPGRSVRVTGVLRATRP